MKLTDRSNHVVNLKTFLCHDGGVEINYIFSMKIKNKTKKLQEFVKRHKV